MYELNFSSTAHLATGLALVAAIAMSFISLVA